MKSLNKISGLVLVLAVCLAATGAAQSAGGRAYGAYVSTPIASLARAPLATLASITDGDIATASADGLNVPSTLTSSFLNSTTVGSVGDTGPSAQSIASLASVSILNGLITADQVIASATSTANGSNADGSSFENLSVAGTSLTNGDGTVEPNTRVDLPGVGYVLLNEQSVTGDGITVNMIHVVLQQPTLGLLGQVTGYRTVGNIIVGSATSSVMR